MSTAAGEAEWLGPLAAALARQGGRGGLLLLLPEYRPELVRVAADRLGLAFLDFRAEVLAGLGWEAARLPLAALADRVAAEAARGPVLVHNAEALLAAKPADERRAWLAAFLERDWPAAVVLPLAVLTAEAPEDAERVVALDRVPPGTLLTRLWSGR